jgi:hypothetical protein
MKKLRTTILIAALVGVVFSNSGALVFCQGHDGHAAIESAMHDHCSGDAEHSREHGHSDDAVYLAVTHEHCRDTMLTTNIIASEKKKTSDDMNEVLASNVCQCHRVKSAKAAHRGHYCWNTESTPFFTPLRTIVLLA